MLAKRLSPLPKRVPLRTSLAMTVKLHDQIFCHIFCASSLAIFPFGFFVKKYFTGTLDQLQVNFLPSHIHIAFMEYSFSTIGIFFRDDRTFIIEC